MPTAKKKETVKELQELFQNSEVLIFTDYRGLSVADITNLRRQLRDKNVEYHVTKNTLTIRAAEHAGLGELGPLLDGPTAIAFVGNDIPGAAKVLGDFVRTSRILQIRGGLVGHTRISADQVSDLTKILTREQYIAKLLGSMQSPISGMMGVMTGVMRGFVNVLQARVDQLKEQGEGGEPAPAEASTTPAEASIAEVSTPLEASAEAPASAEASAETPAEEPAPAEASEDETAPTESPA